MNFGDGPRGGVERPPARPAQGLPRGGRHAKRWQDVEELLDADIDVFTTVNIQHLESLNDKIFELTGVRVRETFPDRLLRRASRIARRVDGRLYLLHVSSDADPLPPEAAATVDRAAGLAADLGATVLRREGQVASTVVAVATEIGVTQIVLGESHRPRWRELVGQSIIAHVLRETDGIDILIVADARARMENLDAGQDG